MKTLKKIYTSEAFPFKILYIGYATLADAAFESMPPRHIVPARYPSERECILYNTVNAASSL